VIEALDRAITVAEEQFEGLVLFNEGDNFSVGANLMLVAMGASSGDFDDIARLAKALQAANQRMKYAKVPVVAAAYGMVLGGGLELCLGASAVQAAAETYAGLVEVGMGLVPARGGCMNLLWRAMENIPEGAPVDSYPWSPRCSRTSPPRRSRRARRWPSTTATSATPTGSPSTARGSCTTRSSARWGWLSRGVSPAGAAELQAPGRERHRDHQDDGGQHDGRAARPPSTTGRGDEGRAHPLRRPRRARPRR
jgi:hypothetical protein